MRRVHAVIVLALGCGGGSSSSNPDGGGNGPDAAPGSAPSHDLGSCTIFPAATGSPDDYSYWNLDISDPAAYPTAPLSAQYVASMGGSSTNVHPDFGSDPTYGIPYDTVAGTQPKLPISFFGAADESDPGPYPFPPDAPIEAGSDGHVLVVDRDNCILYEAGNCTYDAGSSSWSAYSGAVFDLATGAPLRPEGFTSADASGGPILVGLARYEEVSAGVIPHALRFTASTTQTAYVHPATHEAGGTSSTSAPPMGLRMRLKASVCQGLLDGAGTTHPQAKVIVQALCTYGMILADNGSDFYVSGSTDPRWNDDDLSYLKTIPGDDFEAIVSGALH